MAANNKMTNGHPVPEFGGDAVELAPLNSSRQATVGDIARFLSAEMVGDASTLITGIASLDSISAGDIAFIEHESLLPVALDSAASAIIVPDSMAARMRRGHRKLAKPTVFTRNPRLAFAKVMEFLQPIALPEPGIHPTAVIAPDAYIGNGVTIREHCTVGHYAHLGDGVVLFPHVVVGDGAQIGNATILYPSVVVNRQVNIGQRVRVHSGTVLGADGFGYVQEDDYHVKIPHIGTVIIEDDVEIGANVCIDRATIGATRVGAGTKIDNLVQVAHNVQIGRNCILCGQVGLSGSVVVGDRVILAGQMGAADHMRIEDGATVGAQAGVMSPVHTGEVVVGSPAIPQRDFFRTQAAARHLPEALRTLRQLEREVKQLRQEVTELKAK